MLTPKVVLLSLCALTTAGCASFGKGVAQAFLEKQDEEDTRVCQVWGRRFDGIERYLDNADGRLKVLMVHGVGEHLPGYSTILLENLAHQLDLTLAGKRFKEIALAEPADSTKKLGKLRVNRLLSKDRTKELLFYELSWSEITAGEKSVLAYDTSGEYSFRRAEINDLLKRFSNSTGPDPLIYLGEKRKDILTAFGQSLCWMMAGDWEDLPQESSQACDPFQGSVLKHVAADHYVVIAHSLGSRITIDGLQRIAQLSGDPKVWNTHPNADDLKRALQDKRITVFMLSNQLPLLQLGRRPPDVTGQQPAYCSPDGSRYAERTFRDMSLFAFSDPNDVLSYAVPPGFADKYLDSRLCVDITNININVAKVADIFGLGKVANPLEAHVGYDNDPRVIALIGEGIGNGHSSPLVRDRCEWIETIE